MGRRGTRKRGSGKKNKQKDNISISTAAEPNAQQLPPQARKRKKKVTRSAEALIRRARKEFEKGIARQARGPTDPYLAAASAASLAADAAFTDSESIDSESSTPPDWGDNVDATVTVTGSQQVGQTQTTYQDTLALGLDPASQAD